MLVTGAGLGLAFEPLLLDFLELEVAGEVEVELLASRFTRKSFCTYSWSVAM